MCSQTQLDDIANEQTIICKQLFAGHVVEFSANEKKEKFETSCKRLPLLSLSPCRLCYLKFKRVSIIAIDLMYFRSVYALFVTNANKYKQIKLGTVGPVYP